MSSTSPKVINAGPRNAENHSLVAVSTWESPTTSLDHDIIAVGASIQNPVAFANLKKNRFAIPPEISFDSGEETQSVLSANELLLCG